MDALRSQPRHPLAGEPSMKRNTFVLVSLVAMCIVQGNIRFAASSTDAANCHHGFDAAKAKVAAIANPANMTEADPKEGTTFVARNLVGRRAEELQ